MKGQDNMNGYSLKDKHKRLVHDFTIPEIKPIKRKKIKPKEYINLAEIRKINDKKRSIEALGGIRIDDLPENIDLRC